MPAVLKARIGEPDVVRPPQTVLTGLIGAQIGASRQPVIHMSEARAHGFTGIYRLIDIDAVSGTDALPQILSFCRAIGFAGVNVTFPCKQAVIPHLDELSDHARTLGAVNTVVFKDGRAIGHNTDWSGYADAFKAEMAGAKLDRVVQFGAGGAGAAVAYALLMLGVKRLDVIDADPERAAGLAAQFAERFGAARIGVAADAAAAVADADGIVNCTPVGMAKFPGTPFPAEWLSPSHWVSEIIYFPLETELLRRARSLGCRTIDGSGMNVRQAAEAFRLFTGRAGDPDRIRFFFDEAGRPA